MNELTSSQKASSEVFIQYQNTDQRIGPIFSEINNILRLAFGDNRQNALEGRFQTSAGRIYALQTMETELKERIILLEKSGIRRKQWDDHRNRAISRGYQVKDFSYYVRLTNHTI